MKIDNEILLGIGFGIGFVIVTELFDILKTYLTGKPPEPH